MILSWSSSAFPRSMDRSWVCRRKWARHYGECKLFRSLKLNFNSIFNCSFFALRASLQTSITHQHKYVKTHHIIYWWVESATYNNSDHFLIFNKSIFVNVCKMMSTLHQSYFDTSNNYSTENIQARTAEDVRLSILFDSKWIWSQLTTYDTFLIYLIRQVLALMYTRNKTMEYFSSFLSNASKTNSNTYVGTYEWRWTTGN